MARQPNDSNQGHQDRPLNNNNFMQENNLQESEDGSAQKVSVEKLPDIQEVQMEDTQEIDQNSVTFTDRLRENQNQNILFRESTELDELKQEQYARYLQKQKELLNLDKEIARKKKEMQLLEKQSSEKKTQAEHVDRQFNANNVDFGVNDDSESEQQKQINMVNSLNYDKELDKEALEGTYYRLPEQPEQTGADAGFLSALSKEDLAVAVKERRAMIPIKNGLKVFFAKRLVADMK